MRARILYGLLISLASSAFATRGSGDFEQLMKQAHAALSKLDLESARALVEQACESALSADGTSAKKALCETESGAIAEAAGYAEDADLHYRRALPMWNQLGPNYAPFYATTLMDLGSLYRSQRKTAEAEDALTQALTIAGNDPVRATIASRLGSFYSESAAPERGRPLLHEAIAMLRTPALSKPAELAYACNSLGMLDLRAGSYKVSEASLREAVSVAEGSLGESHPDTALYEANLALALNLEGQYDRAEVLLNRARHIAETKLPAGDLRLGTILADLTTVETALGQFARAEADGKQSLAILLHGRGPRSPEVAVQRVTSLRFIFVEKNSAKPPPSCRKRLRLNVNWNGMPASPTAAFLRTESASSVNCGLCNTTGMRRNRCISKPLQLMNRRSAPAIRGLRRYCLEYADVLKHCGASGSDVKDVEARARAIKG